jgi:hypothetical protein
MHNKSEEMQNAMWRDGEFLPFKIIKCNIESWIRKQQKERISNNQTPFKSGKKQKAQETADFKGSTSQKNETKFQLVQNVYFHLVYSFLFY